MAEFKPGDIVRLKAGRLPLEVIHTQGNFIKAAYMNSQYSHQYGSGIKTDKKSKFVLYDQTIKDGKPIEEEEPMSEKDILYTWGQNDTQKFGHRIGTNRDGKAVMEVRGASGAIEIVYPDFLEEVTPYTVLFRLVAGNDRPTTKHFAIGDENFLSVGDLILTTEGNLFIVEKLDTKQRSAKLLSAYMKVQLVAPTKKDAIP